MSEENNNNVNHGLQLDATKLDKLAAGMDEILAERNAEKEKRLKQQKREELLGEIKKQVGDKWEVLNNAKNSSGQTLEEFLKSKPHILDDSDLAIEAVDIFKSRALSQTQKSDPEGDEGEGSATPNRADNSNAGLDPNYQMPEIGSQEWWTDFYAGKITKDTVVKDSRLQDHEKIILLRSIPASPITANLDEARSKFI